MITPDDHFPSGADSLDLTRLHQLLTEMPKETGTGAKDLGMESNQGTKCNDDMLIVYYDIWIHTNIRMYIYIDMFTYYVYATTCQSSWRCMFTYLLTNNKGWTAHVPLAF